MNEKFDIEVYKRRLVIEMEGVTHLEINAMAQALTERMADKEHKTGMSSRRDQLAAYALGARGVFDVHHRTFVIRIDLECLLVSTVGFLKAA